MDLRLDNKVALVTGGGKGIGRGIAITLADLGAKVHVISRTQADLDSLIQEVPSIEVHNVDLADWEKTRAVVDGIGTVDYLVNNAAVGNWTPFFDVTKEELDNLFDINYRGVFNVSQVVAKGMVQRGNGGCIVNISSIAALRASMNHTIYCPSKAAVDMLTKTMALELGPHKIRVNSVNPGLVLTPMVLKEAYSTPESQEAMKNRTPIKRISGYEFVLHYCPDYDMGDHDLATIGPNRHINSQADSIHLLPELLQGENYNPQPSIMAGFECISEVEDIVNACLFLLSTKASMINGISMNVDGGFVL